MAKKKVVGYTVLGNIVEYYDFGIYAVFAPTIGKIFFPAQDRFVEILLAFVIFAIGFLMRPLGGVLFGHIGDKWGRKVALNISIIGMTLSTITLAILPSYNTIGIVAPIILMLIRLLQGLCIGGEGTGSAIFILEHLSSKNTNITGSIVMASNIVGTLLANIVGAIITEYIGLDDFSWRYGFLVGAILGVVGAYLRAANVESPIFEDMKASNTMKKLPIAAVFQSKKFSIVLVIGVAAAATSISYLIRGYINTFFSEVVGYSKGQALFFSIFSLTIIILLLPIFGIISGMVGHNRFLIFVAINICIWILPLFKLIGNPDLNHTQVYIGLTIISILCAAISAPAYPYAISSFPPALRYSGVSFGWNVGNALFGGTTPFISTLLVKKFGLYGPSYYIIVASGLFLLINLALTMLVNRLKNIKAKRY